MQPPIYLIGYMGAGKTTVGKILAQRLNWHFVDLDDAFLQLHGLSTAEYIRQYGIDNFRHKEKRVVEDLSELPVQKVIYATGGGYPCWEDNMDCLLELGTSIYIRWTPENLTQRLLLTDLTQRPLLQGRSYNELLPFITSQLQQREPIYSRAHFIIDAPEKATPKADEWIANQLFKFIQTSEL